MAIDEAELGVIQCELDHDPTLESIVDNPHLVLSNELLVNVNKEFHVTNLDKDSQEDLSFVDLLNEPKISGQVVLYRLDLLI